MLGIYKQLMAAIGILLLGFIVSYILIIVINDPRYSTFCAFFLLLIVFFTFKSLYIKSVPSPTPALAVVMSLGVFVSDLFFKLPYDKAPFSYMVKIAVITIVLMWVFIISSYIASILNKTFYKRHVASTLQSFGMGTWIAGASVCVMGIIRFLPEWTYVAYFIMFMNSMFWLVFISICIRNFIRLRNQSSILCHGLVLLATVSTQSMVVDYSFMLRKFPFKWIEIILIIMGIVFYFIGLIFIIKSYWEKGRDLINDWPATNCILHGALSITGLGGIMAGILNVPLMWGLWAIVILIFGVVEGIEIRRAFLRIQCLGWKQAIGIYHVSHWARNFTFSMLLAFTLQLPRHNLAPILANCLSIFTWLLMIVLLFLFVYQSLLYFKERMFLFNKRLNNENRH